eukprot:CAMPEP_0114277006 /NCGR_PEP_ID=MMETSP0059-20121206/550_1 /TAXON_ID=36894 /ORGANISM="Pyramimonas parkeae, Strain CCMP726" /LENGTH=116 /DNA_ID=CAMNT_0001397063 /DNA_START=1132 /DNA_END=1483 /DNA_ORIENTATION=+
MQLIIPQVEAFQIGLDHSVPKAAKKGQTEELSRKKRRTNRAAVSRSIVGASLEVIQKKRAEKSEVRQAARDAALREIKERQRKVKDDKKVKKAAETKTKVAAPKNAAPKGGKGGKR